MSEESAEDRAGGDVENVLIGAEKVRVMLEALKSPSIIVRSTGARNLADEAVENPKLTVPLLITALGNTEWWTVRFGAVEALTEMAKTSEIKVKSELIDMIIFYLKDDDYDFVVKVAECLGYQANIKAVDALISCMKHKEDQVREMTALALGNLRNKQALTILIEHLNEQNPQIQAACATALGLIGAKDKSFNITPLLPLLASVNDSVYRATGLSLGNIHNPKAIIPLINAMYLKSSTPEGRADILKSISAFSQDEIAKEIKANATDTHQFIDLVEKVTEFLQFPELTSEAEASKKDLIGTFQRTIRRMRNEIDSINAFVADTFKTLLEINEIEKLQIILDSIPRKRKILEEIDFSKIKDYRWVQKELFNELKQAQEWYNLGNSALNELETAIISRKKRLEEESK